MRIGVNCVSVDPAYVGGVNTYVFGLLDAFASLASPHRFRVFASPRNAPLFDRFAAAPGCSVEVIEASAAPCRAVPWLASHMGMSRPYQVASDVVYRRAMRAFERGCDVLYTPTTVLRPFGTRRPQLLSVHDIQHVHYPHFFSASERRQRRLAYSASVEHADWVQASSHFIKDDLLEHFPRLSPRRVVVIPEGVAIEEFGKPSTVPVRDRFSLPERYLFLPAQLWPHKNHLTVLEALVRLRDRRGYHIPLVMTGAAFGAAEGIFRFVAEHALRDVRYLGKVSFSEIVGLYQSAWFTISPGLYESSSLCVLESAAAGTPVIASSIAPNIEMGQALELNFFEPKSVEQLVELLDRVWDDSNLREMQRAANGERIHQFSWRVAAGRYVDFLERAAAGAAA